MVDVTGIIVAGGRSSRMGQDKAMLQLGGVAVLERISAVLGQVAQRVIVVARDTQQYRRFGLEMTTDLYPSLGPLSGIHAGLSASNTEWGIVVACDMPFVQPEVLRALVAQTTDWGAVQKTTSDQRKQEAEGEQALMGGNGLLIQPTESSLQAVIASVDGRIHPLLAVYHQSVLPSAEECLRSGRLRLTDWLDKLNVRYAKVEDLPGVSEDIWHKAAFNMNNPQDYQLAIEQLKHSVQQNTQAMQTMQTVREAQSVKNLKEIRED
ncbi:molybdenum cofactor guanylyltransferase [Paenibacillus sp. FSL R10-2782]|uniref:molybdenum cofactor guanylyltransferase n=1 Tax=Paenibacillus sp. FSL R10-2782 TaxID=2954661 RepID=UPI003158D5E6